MHSDTITSLSAKRLPRIQFPLKPLVVISLALIVVASWVVWQAKGQERDRLLSDLKSRADVLIWALEGSARSMMMQRSAVSPVPQELVEEVAKQPFIAYVAVLDKNGTAVAHSLRDQLGAQLSIFSVFKTESIALTSQGRLIETGEKKLFEVIKAFTPSSAHENGGSGAMGAMRHGHMMQAEPANGFYIVVAMDAAPSLSEVAKHVWHYMLIVFLLVTATIGGVTLLFYMQSLAVSKRMLLDTQRLASQVFEKLPIGVFTTDAEGNVTLCNECGASLLAFPPLAKHGVTVRGHPWFDWKGLVRSLDQGEIILDHEVEFTAENGKITAVSISASVIKQSDGSFSGYLFIVRDLIEVKKLQKQLRLNERLTALGELSAGIAHELRNPLGTVKGYATFLFMKLKDNAPLQEKAGMMLTEVERLSRVVSDLLAMANPGKLQLAPGSLWPIVARVLSLTEQEAATRGVQLIVPPPPVDDDAYVIALDADKMIQALLNLTINAVQATERGGSVQVGIRRIEGAQSKGGSVVVSITDTGNGIPPEVLASIFTPYFTTKPSGTGLGLAIAHGIIEQHGGEISISSKPGKGSVFSVRLPLTGGVAKEHQ